MVEPLRQSGILRVVSPDELTRQEAIADKERATMEDAARASDLTNSNLVAHIRSEFTMMQNHRNSATGWSERLLKAQRVFSGMYDPAKLAQIRQFGGSDVYARVVAVKCRGASSLLRDVYLGGSRPWGLDPTPDPVLPDNIIDAISKLVQTEVDNLAASGQMVEIQMIRDRVKSLMDAAKRAGLKKAREEASKSERKLEDMLVEGGFYKALSEFLVDLPLFPFAVLKGPVVRIVPDVVWRDGKAVVEQTPRMFWSRVSPFDVFFTPGVGSIEDASVIERVQLRRTDLNELIGLPGYDEEAIRGVLRDYRNGHREVVDATDSQRADNENRENPQINQSGIIDCLEYHGPVQGSMLLDWGMSEQEVPDPDRDYFVQAWMIGNYIIKIQISPSPRKRHPYFVTSYEKVPGTIVGNALPDILEDIQDVCNATLRSLVNNLSISSGPQVVVNDDRITPGTDGEELYPWKRWHVSADPMSNSGQQPITFFQPNSNAQELLVVYEKFTQIADELSAIPRYTTGSDRLGGAARTSSGLAMLMNNASKVLQMVAANVDRDCITPLLQQLYDMVMLTDETGMFRGDESIRVRGVDVAVQRETNRQRQIEFMQATANPFDIDIIGRKGRASLLRSVSETLGLDGEEIVPTEDELVEQEKQRQIMAQQQAMMGAPPGAPGAIPSQPPKGVSPQPAPENTDPGVQDGKSMRGMV